MDGAQVRGRELKARPMRISIHESGSHALHEQRANGSTRGAARFREAVSYNPRNAVVESLFEPTAGPGQ